MHRQKQRNRVSKEARRTKATKTTLQSAWGLATHTHSREENEVRIRDQTKLGKGVHVCRVLR